jgi:tetratricopeptide (TPR) repeat protein
MTIVISDCYGQSTIDSIEKDYARGDFGAVIHKIKNELKSDTTLKNKVYYYGRLGDIYCTEQHLDSALYFINIAIGLDDSVGHTVATRARIYDFQRKYKEALDDMNKAIQLSPESVHYYYHRAVLYKTLNKKRLSRQDFEKVKELAKKENNKGLYDSADNELRNF